MEPSAGEQIATQVLTWPGVEAAPHRFGGTEFRLGRRQLGHLHGNQIADLPLPRPLHDELIATGCAQIHRWRPDSGWITIPLSDQQAISEVIGLLRASYERAQPAQERREPDTHSRSR